MKVEISYTFDASELGGQNLVTFEELYDLKNPWISFTTSGVAVAVSARTGTPGSSVRISAIFR